MNSKVSFNFRENVYSSEITFPKVEEIYGIKSTYSKKEGIIIKVKANKLKAQLKYESNVVSGFGEIFPILCTNKGITFTNKIDAVLKKERGRHIYDLMFMLSNNFPIDKKTLLRLKIKEPKRAS